MNNHRVISQFLEYVQIESPSRKEADFAKVLKAEMEDIGFEVLVDEKSMKKTESNTGNLIGYLKGNKDVEPIMFCAHMDTVTPCENIEPIIEDGVIKSAGNTILSADDKAGVVAILEGVKQIKENNIPHGDIEVVFNVCEEIGLLGAKSLDYSKIKSKMGFILDSGGTVGDVVVQGPAQVHINAEFHGIAAHAGLSPEKGISAIQVASRAIDKMNLLRIDEETTANVGVINGGSVTNIVADHVSVEFECRSLNEDKLDVQVKHMVDTIEKAAKDFDSTVDIEVINKYPVFSVSEDEPILDLTKKAMLKSGVDYNPMSTGGGSDTNIINGKGISTVNLGVGMENAHSVDEYITVENIIKASELVADIVKSM